MSDLLKHNDGRTHMRSPLMRESLVSRKLLQAHAGGPVAHMLDGIHMLAVGGRSIMDRGASAILPLVKAIGEARAYHRVVGVGGGARTRHTFAIGLDLGLPVGGLARLTGASEEQNRDILQFLLAPYGGVTFVKEHFQDIALYLSEGRIPVCIGQPPYHFYEPPPADGGRLPDNGPDVGLFLMGEIFGCASMLLIKDVKGLYTADPKQDPGATFIPKITVEELMAMDLPDLPVERELLRTFARARTTQSLHIINGLDPANITKALAGEHVGTLIVRDGGSP